MPVYQYACTDCGEPLEVRQSFTDDALTVCPACEGRLRKVLSPVGVVFKGSGFYRTDSRAASTASGRNGSGAASAKGEGGSGAATNGAGKDSSSSSSNGSASGEKTAATASSGGASDGGPAKTPAAAH